MQLEGEAGIDTVEKLNSGSFQARRSAMFRREKKMKRFLCNFLLCACMMVLLSVCAFAAQVSVSDMKVKVNGVEQTAQVYLIDGNNYFKLRDLAMMLRETPSRFEVGYDSETKTVTMTPGRITRRSAAS